MPIDSRFPEPAELIRIMDLELVARTVVDGFRAGFHRSTRTGSSFEFSMYRPYAQGDDLRFVDWRRFGRSDRLYLKQSHAESNLKCTFLLDRSASMGFASGSVSKFAYARMLVASLAMLLHRQNDAVGFMAYHDQVDPYFPAKSESRHFHQLLVALAQVGAAGTSATGDSLRYLGQVLPPRGMIVLVSDLLHPADETLEQLRSLRARRHEVLVCQISDRAEETFPFDRDVTLLDPETGNEQYSVPERVREEYQANRRRHFDRIRAECLGAEIGIQEFFTDEPLQFALQAFLARRRRALIRGGKQTGGRHA